MKQIFIFLFCLKGLTGTTQVMVPFDSIEIKCLNLLSEIPNEIVINTDKEYSQLRKYIHSYRDCGGYQLPKIDFRSKTLIGVMIRTGGCEEPTFLKEAFMENKKFVYRVTVTSYGICRRGFTSIQWILADKTEDQIKFERKNNYL
jgi:hypothetical protein